MSKRKLKHHKECRALLDREQSSKKLRACEKMSKRELRHHKECRALLDRDSSKRASPKKLRACEKMTKRQLKHHSECKAILDRNHEAAKDRKTPSSGHHSKKTSETRRHEAT